MACGDQYAWLLRTSDGRTPDNPCEGWEPFCLTGSYDGWKTAVDNIAVEVKRRIELAERGGVQIPDDVAARSEQWVESVEALPGTTWSPSALFTMEQNLISRAVVVGQEGLCLLELLDDVLRSGGLSPPATAGTTPAKKVPPSIGESFKTLIAGGVIAAVAYGAYKISRRQER